FIVKVNPFYRKDSEDTQKWIEIFLRAKKANGWPDNRRVAIAAGMLREEAANWYNLVSTTINRWDRDANTGFRERFLICFSS
ncbi:14620_t:CDS:1, partial [Funneliformis mosseae]